MANRVIVYQIAGHRRSFMICQAMTRGIATAGDKPYIADPVRYKRPLESVTVFYGFSGSLPKIMGDYKKAGLRAVYIDLGYWGRDKTDWQQCFHKVSVNSRHPTEYFQQRLHSDDRAKKFDLKIEPWRTGEKILIAGMGSKAAGVEGYSPARWEKDTLAQLRCYTDRPIVYRPKPSWKNAVPIPGCEYSPPEEPVETALANCQAVVTHHSNLAVDGLVCGIPAFCWHGVAKPMAKQAVADIETPLRPEGREQWINDIAYAQWSIEEMAQGLAWRHLKDEGLIP